METDLYKPLRNYFLSKNYTVQAEVKDCDIVCFKDKLLTVIEIKKAFNLKLLYQALDRKSFADCVYIAIPRPKNFRKKEVKYMLQILSNLNIGLITISDDTLENVEIILTPETICKKVTRKKRSILNEFEGRNLDLNIGGSSSKQKIITAYREKSIFLVCILLELNTITPLEAKSISGIYNTGNILRDNHYNYFEKVTRGVYKLSNVGILLLSTNEDILIKTLSYYKNKVKNNISK